jgi:hypothetical protein
MYAEGVIENEPDHSIVLKNSKVDKELFLQYLKNNLGLERIGKT